MVVKCLYCRHQYTQAASHEKHLHTTHAGLGMTLMSTVQSLPSDDLEFVVSGLNHRHQSWAFCSDYESDSQPEVYELDNLDLNGFLSDAEDSDNENTQTSAANA
ncbi:hypothetical protein HOY80DRAFT_1034172 [Tuber brumale]|nr:hypothetical protein HOY80DRAFT_1034172 [Tuber brumale]